jgi:integrase
MRHMLHSVVDIPIAEGAPGTSLPFLFLEDGELSLLALAWTRKKMLDEEVGPSSLAKAVSAIGRFYDYYKVERHGVALAPEELRLMLKQFYEARRFGLVSLGWEPVKVDTADGDVRAINEFTDWCSENFGHASVNERESVLVSSLNLPEQKAFQLKLSSRKNWDFLYHLTPSTQEGKGVRSRRPFSPKRGKSRKPTGAQKYYPPLKVWSTIAATPLLRDKLYLLLLFFGGVRISEPLHLYATDVSIQPDGTARVVLGHPQDGAYEWVGVDKRRRRGNRATFLLERYGLGPRNLLASTHPLHAGWKGMMADDGKRSESVVHWLRDDASRLFAKLHAEYVRTMRSKVPDTHPYYFVNELDGDTYGQPLKMSNISKAFDRAAKRVGLSVKQDGVNPHGGRHFYGYYCASLLRLPVETTQKLMHHSSISSTEIYYALTAEAVRAELLAAQQKQALEAPGLLAAPLSPQQLSHNTHD